MNFRNKILNYFYPNNQVIIKYSEKEQKKLISIWKYKFWTRMPFNDQMTREEVKSAFKK